MPSRPPLASLPFAILLALSVAAGARAQGVLDNHPGLWIEWLRHAKGPINAIAMSDAEQDGDPDLLVADGATLELWRNPGTGEFVPDASPIASLALRDVIAIDLDGDSRQDLVGSMAQEAGGGIVFLRSLGAGRYASPEIASAGIDYSRLAGIDVDGDGRVEIAAALAYPARGMDVHRFGAGTFTRWLRLLPDFEVASLTAADLNRDGKMDLITGTRWFGNSAQLQVLMNDGRELETGAVVPTIGSPAQVAPLDLDGDGDIDLFYAGYESGGRILLGDGTGRSWEAREAETYFGYDGPCAASADLDHDGSEELYVGWARSQAGVVFGRFKPRLDPTLSAPTIYSYTHGPSYGGLASPSRMMIADVNGDGWEDLVMVSPRGSSYSSSSSGSQGMVGVVLNHRGMPGCMGLASLPASGYSVSAARLDRHSASLLLGSAEGMVRAEVKDDGTLGPLQGAGSGQFFRAADVTRDGLDDLIVRLENGWTEVRVTAGKQPGAVAARILGTVIDLGCIDPDPWVDLLVSRPDGHLDIVWGDRGARFRRATPTGLETSADSHKGSYGLAPRRALLADADGDGRREIVECSFHRLGHNQPVETDTILVHPVLPSGRLGRARQSLLAQSLPQDALVAGVRAADMDGVRGDELVVLSGSFGNNYSRFHVFRSLSDGRYEIAGDYQAGGEAPSGLTLADLDGDGDLDAACGANWDAYIGVLNVRWNDGHGALSDNWYRRFPNSYVHDVTAGDFDGDGTSDVAALTSQYGLPGSEVALVFGRREGVSATVSDLEFSELPGRGVVTGFVVDAVLPNPARGTFAVQWSGLANSPASIELHDVAGRRVRSTTLPAGSNDGTTRFEVKDLPAGLYWIRLRQGTQTVTKRVALIR